jgi:hypothetical protein
MRIKYLSEVVSRSTHVARIRDVIDFRAMEARRGKNSRGGVSSFEIDASKPSLLLVEPRLPNRPMVIAIVDKWSRAISGFSLYCDF